MNAVQIIVYTLPPMLALIWAATTNSGFAKTALLTGSFLSLVLFAMFIPVRLDCAYVDFSYTNCGLVAPWIAQIFSSLEEVYVFAYLIGGPILLVIAALAEMVSRTRL